MGHNQRGEENNPSMRHRMRTGFGEFPFFVTQLCATQSGEIEMMLAGLQ